MNECKKLAVSQETFDKLTEEFINNLKQNENVVLVVMPREEIFSHTKKNSDDISGIILAQDEAKEYEKELIEQQRIIEFQTPHRIEELIENLPQMIYADPRPFPSQKQQNKYYVPRTIGRPNSKKKGGR